MRWRSLLHLANDLPNLKRDVKQPLDKLEEINLETNEDPPPTFISRNITLNEKESYIYFLIHNLDIFAWTYFDMPGFNRKVTLLDDRIG